METKQVVTMATDNLAGWYQGYRKHIVYCVYIYIYFMISSHGWDWGIFWSPYGSTHICCCCYQPCCRTSVWNWVVSIMLLQQDHKAGGWKPGHPLQSSITTRLEFVSGSSAAFCFVLWRLAPISKTPSRLSRLGWMETLSWQPKSCWLAVHSPSIFHLDLCHTSLIDSVQTTNKLTKSFLAIGPKISNREMQWALVLLQQWWWLFRC